jgi:hypothetical protein
MVRAHVSGVIGTIGPLTGEREGWPVLRCLPTPRNAPQHGVTEPPETPSIQARSCCVAKDGSV